MFSLDVTFFGSPHNSESLMRLALSVRRGATYICFGALITDFMTFWGDPHRHALRVSFNPRTSYPFCCSPDLLIGKPSTPEIITSPYSRSMPLWPITPLSLPPLPLLVLGPRSSSQPLSSLVNLGALQPCVSGIPLLTKASELYRELLMSSPPAHKGVNLEYLSLVLTMVLRIFGGFTEIPFVLTVLVDACTKLLPVGSSVSFLVGSSSSLKEKLSSPYPLPMERGVSSDSLSRACFRFFISLYSCIAVSTGPEDAIEIASVNFVDEVVWTLTSLFVTILLLSNTVVKAVSMHSSIVLNLLSTSFEDLSCLSDLVVVVYLYCQ